jgi:hypothetical protein
LTHAVFLLLQFANPQGVFSLSALLQAIYSSPQRRKVRKGFKNKKTQWMPFILLNARLYFNFVTIRPRMHL